LEPDVLRHTYNFTLIRSLLRGEPPTNVMEIGAGSGFFALMVHQFLKPDCITIVDLPALLATSAALLLSALPPELVVLPHETDRSEQRHRIRLILPDQIEMIDDESQHLAVNLTSFMEMERWEIGRYFDLIERVVSSDGGLFFCANRYLKETLFFDY